MYVSVNVHIVCVCVSVCTLRKCMRVYVSVRASVYARVFMGAYMCM